MVEGDFTKILRWSYDRQVLGFTEQDLFNTFNIKSNEKKLWFENSFRGSDGDLIGYYREHNGQKYSTLTPRGINMAIAYLGLDEAKKGAKEARRIAIFSIWIAVIVGLVQILIDIWPILFEK